VLTTVLGNAYAQGGEVPSPQVRATDLSYASRYLAIGVAGHQVLTYTVACLILLIFVVIVPAVWSTSETRRAAAQEVLDKLLHFMRPRR
jgi:hypothetical protein